MQIKQEKKQEKDTYNITIYPIPFEDKHERVLALKTFLKESRFSLSRLTSVPSKSKRNASFSCISTLALFKGFFIIFIYKKLNILIFNYYTL